MADQFLNKTGLQYFFNRIKTIFENKIEAVKVNGTALTPDAQKAVNIEIDEVFVATYGETTAAEIEQAIADRKVIIVANGSFTSTITQVDFTSQLIYLGSASSSGTIAVAHPTATLFRISRRNNSWSIKTATGASKEEMDVISSLIANTIQPVIPADASATNQLATKEYVDENGGAINSIVFNGAEVPLEDKAATIDSGEVSHGSGTARAEFYGKNGTATFEMSNVVEGVEQDEVTIDIAGEAAATLPTKSYVDRAIPTKTSELTNDSGFQTADEVESLIDEKISAVYKPQGAIAFESLPALSASIEGYVYNITNNFVTTADFIEGAGHAHSAGTNVVCVKHNDVYMWDCLHGVVDLSAYWTSASGETNTLSAITTAEIDTIVAG